MSDAAEKARLEPSEKDRETARASMAAWESSTANGWKGLTVSSRNALVEAFATALADARDEAREERDRLANGFLMAYDLAAIDSEPLPERLPESAYVPGYMDKVRELREVHAIAVAAIRSGKEGKENG